jgi:hypothetical protein
MVVVDCDETLDVDDLPVELEPAGALGATPVEEAGAAGLPGLAGLVGRPLEEIERLRLAEQVAGRVRSLHWDLEFADLLASGGFDLIVGNPPWLKVTWEEKGVLSDFEPLAITRSLTAAQLALRRGALLSENQALRGAYVEEYESQSATQSFLGALPNYSLLRGSITNLYKCFLIQAWRITANDGVSGFVHPEGVYDDPNGGELRRAVYQRARYHFQFSNEFKLFPIGHRAKFSLNIFSSPKEPHFISISNLFTTKTIAECLESSVNLRGGGIKDENGEWNTAGGKERIIEVDTETLLLFAQVFDDSSDALTARLPVLFSSSLVSSLRAMSTYSKKLSSLKSSYLASLMWSETNAIKIEKSMRKNTGFPESSEKLILSGPHFMTATPFYQTPRRICDTHRSYDYIDLEFISATYLPRTNFEVLLSGSQDLARMPKASWASDKSYVELPRVVARKRIDPTHERTLKAALMPRGAHHINSCISFAFKNEQDLLCFSAGLFSLPFDFFVKSTGKADFLDDLASKLPMITPSAELAVRVLCLNCVSNDFADFWSECWSNEFLDCKWSGSDSRLNMNFFSGLTRDWLETSFLKSDLQRRQALLEIDVLVAMQLGLSLDELISMYRIQFPVMQQYERDTWYDQKGRIVFTTSKGLTGVGFPRKGSGRAPNKTTGWEDIAGMKSGSVSRAIVDDTLPGGQVERTITYEAPFDLCDRVKDYRVAWEFFIEHRGTDE